jgi:hypothetical protein
MGNTEYIGTDIQADYIAAFEKAAPEKCRECKTGRKIIHYSAVDAYAAELSLDECGSESFQALINKVCAVCVNVCPVKT